MKGWMFWFPNHYLTFSLVCVFLEKWELSGGVWETDFLDDGPWQNLSSLWLVQTPQPTYFLCTWYWLIGLCRWKAHFHTAHLHIGAPLWNKTTHVSPSGSLMLHSSEKCTSVTTLLWSPVKPWLCLLSSLLVRSQTRRCRNKRWEGTVLSLSSLSLKIITKPPSPIFFTKALVAQKAGSLMAK